MADVFLSYSKPDIDMAAWLADALGQAGFSVFYDQNLSSGQSWDSVIDAELDAARTVVVLWTATSVERRWVRNEARFALQNDILCPVLGEPCRIPVEFNHVHAEDLTGWPDADMTAKLARLSTAITAKLKAAPVTAPTAAKIDAAPSGFMEKIKSVLALRPDAPTNPSAQENTPELPDPGDPQFRQRMQSCLQDRAEMFGLQSTDRARYFDAMRHALDTFRSATPETQIPPKDIAASHAAKKLELLSTEAAVVARARALKAKKHGESMQLDWQGSLVDSDMPRTGTYVGETRGSVPHGVGTFFASFHDQNSQDDVSYEFCGEWHAGQFSGCGTHTLLSSDYNRSEREGLIRCQAGFWREGLPNGYSVTAENFGSWSLENVWFQSHHNMERGVETGSLVKYRRADDFDLHSWEILKSERDALSSRKFIRAEFVHNRDGTLSEVSRSYAAYSGSAHLRWTPNPHIF